MLVFMQVFNATEQTALGSTKRRTDHDAQDTRTVQSTGSEPCEDGNASALWQVDACHTDVILLGPEDGVYESEEAADAGINSASTRTAQLEHACMTAREAVLAVHGEGAPTPKPLHTDPFGEKPFAYLYYSAAVCLFTRHCCLADSDIVCAMCHTAHAHRR